MAAVMSVPVVNPFIQLVDPAAVMAAHERVSKHAAVTCRVVCPLDQRAPGKPGWLSLDGSDEADCDEAPEVNFHQFFQN